MSTSSEIHEFIQDIRLVSEEHYEIVVKIRELFNKHSIKPNESIKYNGITFNLEGSIVGGVYPNKKHVSLEFSNGANLKDSEGILEGSGKKRRHIKLFSVGDILDKEAEIFVKAALLQESS